ncbi:unnamed protein product, partial [Ostreobium quekettii]
AWKLRTKQVEEMARQEEEERMEENKRNQCYLKHQMQIRERQAAAAKLEEREIAGMLLDNVEDGERRFKEYATACVDEWGRRRQTTEPMALYMAKTESPRLDPAI